jgi:F-type H+-transporting ATPase subunit epsilon
MANMLQCDIVTPERKLASLDASMVVVPAYDGEMGILSMHVPIVSVLGKGEVRCTLENDEVEHYVIDGGYVQVTTDDKVIVLADNAIKTSEIDLDAVKAQIADLQTQVEALEEGDPNAAFLSSKLEWAKVQERVVTHQ